MPSVTPHKFANLSWPPSPGQWKALNDSLEDIYQRLRTTSGDITVAFDDFDFEHALLDAVHHTDTTTGTVVTGDVITGQASKWARLAKGSDGSLFSLVAGAPSWVSGQIAFPATQNPSSDVNTLDDYEEGTWTPVLGGSTSQSGQTYATQAGTYLKVGKLVIAWARVQLSLIGTITGSLMLKGLPFTVENITVGGFATAAAFWASWNTNYVVMQANVSVNTTEAFILVNTAAASSLTTQPTTTDLTNVSDFRTCVIYRASA